jgi:hypothetical protein
MSMPAAAALHHTCFLVRDIDKAARALSDALGVAPGTSGRSPRQVCRVHGKESPFSFRVALTTVGGGAELISPHTGRTVYDGHLSATAKAFIIPVSSTRRSKPCEPRKPNWSGRAAS